MGCENIVRKWVGVIFCVFLFQGSNALGFGQIPALIHSTDRYFGLPEMDSFCEIQNDCFAEHDDPLRSTILANVPDVRALPSPPGSAPLFMYAIASIGVCRARRKKINLDKIVQEILRRNHAVGPVNGLLLYNVIFFILLSLYTRLLGSDRSKLSRAIRNLLLGNQILSLVICQPRSPPETLSKSKSGLGHEKSLNDE
jgi:hypothetical protein